MAAPPLLAGPSLAADRNVSHRGDGQQQGKATWSVSDLARESGLSRTTQTLHHIKRYNETATPFAWNYTGKPLTV